jgi:hypothetical protein
MLRLDKIKALKLDVHDGPVDSTAQFLETLIAHLYDQGCPRQSFASMDDAIK